MNRASGRRAPAKRRRRRRKELIITSAFGERSDQLARIVYLVPKRFRHELIREASIRRMSVRDFLANVIELYMASVRRLERSTVEGVPVPPTRAQRNGADDSVF